MATDSNKHKSSAAQKLAERIGVDGDRSFNSNSVAERYGVRVKVRKLFQEESKLYLKWMFEQSKGYRFSIILITLLRSLSTFIAVRTSLINKDLLDAVQLGDFDFFYRSAAFLIAVILGNKVLEFFTYYYSSRVLNSILKSMRVRTFNNALRKDYAEVSRVRSQDWIERIRADVDYVGSTVMNQTASLVQLAVQLITSANILFMLDSRFILIALISLAPTIITYRYITPIDREYEQVQRAFSIRLSQFLQENILHMSVVRAFGIHDYAEENADNTFEAQSDLAMDLTRWAIKKGILYDAYAFITGTCLTIYCSYSILTGRMTYGSMGALISLFGQFRGTAKSLIGVLPSFISLFVHVERLVSLEQLDDALTDDFLNDEEILDFYDREFVGIGLENVSFAYPKLISDSDEEIIGEKQDKLVLNNMSIKLKKGEFTAITGQSGFGKSTIMKLLLGLYTPDTGSCYIQTTTDKQDFDSKYQKLFAYVPQGNMLMQGTIREAVCFGISSKLDDDEGIWEALRLACADKFVSEFTDGLDTYLGELGAGLSEGQTQRLSLARAIYSGHPIIMLDESTSALDPDTESQLLQNLKDLHNKTLVIITHRQSVVDVCDQNIHLGTEEL